MPALIELKGQELGTQRIVIERGPVRVFAAAVKDPDGAYRDEHAAVPPTFPFAMAYWGALDEDRPRGLPIDRLRGPGRMMLHGEQEFVYHRWPRVGDTLEGSGRVSDVYEKERSGGGGMEFYVTDTDWRDAFSGEPVVTARFTLIVNYRPT